MNWISGSRNMILLFLCLVPYKCRGAVTGYECNYEINIFDAWCGMTQESGDDFDWMRKTSDDDTFTDPEPSIDHTTHLVHGHYLYAPTGDQLNGHVGQLNLPEFERNREPQCLELFYQIGGDNAGRLNVYQWLSSSIMPSTAAWTMTGDTADVWNRGTLTIDPQSDVYKVSIEALAGIGVSAFIALDDVKLSDGACPLEYYSCTFEEGMCSLTQDRTDDEDWYRRTGANPLVYVAPSVDHTLMTDQGYYIMIESLFFQRDEVTRVITPPLRGVSDGSPQACLVFFYHMFGPGVGALKVYVVPVGSDLTDVEPSWMLVGDRGNKWRGAEVDITLADDFTIVFEGVRGRSYAGDVALDDLNFTRGYECPGHHKPSPGDQQGTCDFEEIEICEYTQDQTDDADWLWQNRASSIVDNGPVTDHTTNDEFGYYLFLYGDVGHRRTARIISPMVPVQGSHTCLEFWWHLYGNDDQKLSVCCVKDGAEIPETPLLGVSGDHGDNWLRSRHEIPPDMTPCRLIFEGTTGIHNRDDIAIDDVTVFQSEQCPDEPYNIDPTTTPATTSNIDCDFESTRNPTCGWTQSIRDGFDWVLWNGETPDYSSGPAVDHTTQTADGHYLLVNSYADLPRNTKAELISPLIAPTFGTRCFHFYYFMNGHNTYFLNVFIVPYGYTLAMDPDLQLYGNKGSQWTMGHINLPPSSRSFYITVEGSIGPSRSSSDMAIDDFTITNGKCTDLEPPSLPSVANCDFETDMCGYTQLSDEYNNDDDFDWFLNSGSTGTDGTGPSADHTLGTADGHYLYLEASQPRRPGDRATIVSPVITYFNDSYCLVFFFHMSGDDTATLSVKHRGDYYPEEEIARLTGSLGSGWQPYNVEIPVKYGPSEIVFTGFVGNGYRGDIGLDDITVIPGPCGGNLRDTLLSCNLEFGYSSGAGTVELPGYSNYGLVQTTDDPLDWVWFDALVGGTPPIDWSGYGSFIYVDGSNATSGDSATISTSTFTLSRNHNCFSFLYALKGNMRLDVVRSGLDGSKRLIQSFSAQTGQTSQKVLIESSADDSDQYRILLTAVVVGEGENGLVVLDNIYLHSGYCDINGTDMSSNSTLAVAVILGILLFVSVLLIILVALNFRKKSKSASFSPN